MNFTAGFMIMDYKVSSVFTPLYPKENFFVNLKMWDTFDTN